MDVGCWELATLQQDSSFQRTTNKQARRTMINEYRMTKDRWRYSIIIYIFFFLHSFVHPFHFYCCVACHWCFVILRKRGLNTNFLHFSLHRTSLCIPCSVHYGKSEINRNGILTLQIYLNCF